MATEQSGATVTREFLAERDVRMFKMRQAGVANQEIARRFGTSIGAVGKAVNRQLEKLNAEALLAYPEVLRMELERLDQLQSAIWPMTQHRRVTLDDGTDISVEPDMKAIQQVLSIMNRRSRLLGMEQQNVSVRVATSVGGPDAIRQVLAGSQALPTATANSPEEEAKKLLALMVKSGVVSSAEVSGALGEDATNSLLDVDIVDAEIVEETDG